MTRRSGAIIPRLPLAPWHPSSLSRIVIMPNCHLPLWIGLSWCCLFPAGSLQAQSSYFIGAAPEVSRITVEHTKVVTIGGGSSSRTSMASGLHRLGHLTARPAAGLRLCRERRDGLGENRDFRVIRDPPDDWPPPTAKPSSR